MEKRLSRKDKVLYCVKKLTQEHMELYNKVKFGFDTELICTNIGINRSNASKELNRLVKEKVLVKIKGKPVQYLHKKSIEELMAEEISDVVFNSIEELNMDTKVKSYKEKQHGEISKSTTEEVFNLIGYDGSLKSAIEQAKAAVIYPPKGLNTLIIGPTGVGKSLFAEYMYKYSLTINGENEDKPFIIFNCADYSDNQQLLLSQLFGYVKGAFTGADKDKYGLVHEANNGILFLDEVHRLSSEGQEMLFLLIDKGIYRRLGEGNRVHESKIMIIAATTEEPENAMLQTFLRRIPVIVKIPSLEERGIKERMNLVCHFFKEESRRVGVKLKVSKEVIKAFVLYKCKGNIGQLKSDIQLICARAFLDYMTYKRNDVYVKLSLLPNNIREGLYENNRREEIISTFNLIGKEDITFLPENKGHIEDSILIENKKYDLDFYNIIKQTWIKLEEEGVEDTKIRETINKHIQKYSYDLMDIFIYNGSNKTAYDKIINDSILNVVKNVLLKYDGLDEKDEIDRLVRAVALHIQNLIERIKIGNIVSHPNKEEIMKERVYEYRIAKEILDSVSNMYDIEIPLDEAIFLATFLHLTCFNANHKNVAILVIMHGESTASSMVNVANNLLDCNHAVALNMNLQDRVQDVLIQAIKVAREVNKGKGILILTDMGSILTFAKVIEDVTSIPVKAIDMVSTPIVIEATRKALNPDIDLENLYTYILESMEKHYGVSEKIRIKGENNKRYFDKILIDNISKTLTFLDGQKAYTVLNEVINKICDTYNLYIYDDVLVKFIFHCSCMIERCIVKDYLTYKSYEDRLKRSEKLYEVIKAAFKIVEETFAVTIWDMEYANILDIFESQYGTDVFKK